MIADLVPISGLLAVVVAGLGRRGALVRIERRLAVAGRHRSLAATGELRRELVLGTGLTVTDLRQRLGLGLVGRLGILGPVRCRTGPSVSGRTPGDRDQIEGRDLPEGGPTVSGRVTAGVGDRDVGL